MTLPSSTDITNKIYNAACKLFDEFWDGTPIRQIGVHTSHAKIETCTQLTLFDDEGNYSLSAMNQAVDEIRLRYGDNAIFRACFLKSIARNVSAE